MHNRLTPALAAAVTLGLVGQLSAVESPAETCQVSGTVAKRATIVADRDSVTLSPDVIPDNGSAPPLSGGSVLTVSTNFDTNVTITADTQVSLTPNVGTGAVMTCVIAMPPLYVAPAGSVKASGGNLTKQWLTLAGQEEPRSYTVNVTYSVAAQSWLKTQAGGYYSGTTTYTVAPD